MLAPCCSQLHTLAQIALMRRVSSGMLMEKSTNKGALQEQQTRKVASKSYRPQGEAFSEDLRVLRLQTDEIRHWLEYNSSFLEACHLFLAGVSILLP